MIDFVKPPNNDDKFDLIVCGDALVYLGALEDVFNGVSHQLVDGGIFCFTVEDLNKGDFALQPTGRYAHNKEYVLVWVNINKQANAILHW